MLAEVVFAQYNKENLKMEDGQIVGEGWDFKVGKRTFELIHSFVRQQENLYLRFYRRNGARCWTLRAWRWQLNFEKFE